MANPVSKSHAQSNQEFAENIFRLAQFGFSVVTEVIKGVFEFQLPLFVTLLVMLVFRWGLLSHWDYALLSSDLALLYPRKPAIYNFYYYCVLFSPAFVWGALRLVTRKNRAQEVDTVFRSSGVTNRIGQAPKHVGTFRQSDGSSVMRVSAKGISIEDFKKSKPALEQSLRAHVESFKPNLATGTIDIRYSKEDRNEPFEICDRDFDVLMIKEFIVGKSQGRLIRADLGRVPHLLVAGETGGGKSTFLRQFITSLYLNDTSAQFTLIDLKAGLEFYLFKNTARTTIVTDLDKAIVTVGNLEHEISRRFRVLEESQCRDLDSYRDQRGTELPRHIVVIDEVAELFLTNGNGSPELTKARATLNRIARQGRALGLHLVLATQRPDARSLDPQIKANLSGVLCFAMVNDASSISVLGNGHATELSTTKGRAIWKVGSTETEVQTPYLDEDTVKSLMAPHKIRITAAMAARKQEEETANRYEPI